MSAIRAGTDDCNGFEPQNYLRDRCKKCFRLKTKHTSTSGNGAIKPPPAAGNTLRRPAVICATAVTTMNLITDETSPSSSTLFPATLSTSTASTSTFLSPIPLNVTASASSVSHSIENNNNNATNYKTTAISTQNFKTNSSTGEGGKTRTRHSLSSGTPIMSTSLIVTPSSATPSNNSARRNSIITSASIDNIIINNNNGSSEMAGASLKSSASFGKKERRRSWRDRTAMNPDEGADYDDTADSISLASYKTANSKGISSTKSMESVNSTTDSRSMVTAMSGGSANEDDRAITPTDVAEFLVVIQDRDIMNLRKENTRLQDQVAKLKNERQRWTRLRRSSKSNIDIDASSMDGGDERLAEAESLLQEYREENSTLKSELRVLQENCCTAERLRNAESRCEEMTQRNSELQRNVDELQQEIEEMQDQYREEEIDEFRELQRELEQNAKNCRILQFKLRKSERQHEQLIAEKNVFAAKLRDAQQQLAAAANGNASKTVSNNSENNESEITGTVAADAPKEARVRELESELRIAKEVSVRLHNELEIAEDKRYKLEDEIFYYKEKLREIQTQNKWRETRNRNEKAGKRQAGNDDDDGGGGGGGDKAIAAAFSRLDDGDEATKVLRDVLERETDLREQLKFTEEDLHRTQNRLKEAENENEELLQKLVGLSEGKTILAQVNAQNQARAKSRAPLLRSLRTGQTVGKDVIGVGNNEVEKDIAKLLKTIHELEQKNGELQIQLQKSEAKLLTWQSQHTGTSENRGLSVELRKEQEQRKDLQAELLEYKQLIAKSDNNKLIAMATKVEILSNQLKTLNDRCETLHKKALKDVKDDKYTQSLKVRCDLLERQLAEQKAKQSFQPQGNQPAISKAPTVDEIEHCCALLASVDTQANRIAKQLEKMDIVQKEDRRRSLNKDTYAIVVADLVSVMAELKVLHKLLETHKIYTRRETKSGVNKMGDEATNASSEMTTENEVAMGKNSCGLCVEKMATIDTHQEEITFYKKKNKELTNQILQTEDRWTAEIERQNVDHQAKIDKLKEEMRQLKVSLREQIQLADAQAQAFGEKDKLIEEINAKMRRVDAELVEKQRIIQELEKEQRELKEWEIRHKKLESLYNKEKQKFDAEKARIKMETNALKKRTDDALTELTRLRDGHQRREILWTEERSRLEQEITQLKGRLAQTCNIQTNNNIDQSETTRTVPIRTINYRTAAVAAAARNDAKNDEQTERLRQKCLTLEKRNEEVEHQLQNSRASNARLEVELAESRQLWQRERDTVTHKSRQDEKIRGVEIEALQQKFTSRMNIMEASNKSLHSQLVQTRRERDALRDNIAAAEQKLKEQIKAAEAERDNFAADAARAPDVEKRLNESLANVKRLNSELALAKEIHRADKKLWEIEKERYVADAPQANGDNEARNRITNDALCAAEDVQKQYAEYQKFYNKEVSRLKAKIKGLNNQMTSKEKEFQRRAEELTEQIKILDIDQKNLVQVKEMQASARDAMQVEQARLTQLLKQTEVHRISRRYRIASIIEQLNALLERNASSGLRGAHSPVLSNGTSAVQLISIINQLNSLKDNDGIIQGQCPTAIGETLSEADTTAPSDTVSQCSASVRSMPRVHQSSHHGNRNGGQYGTLTGSQRSGSVESNATWDSCLLDYTARSVSPTKRVFYADTLHSNKNKPNYFTRMGSSMFHDTYGSSSAVGGTATRLNLRQMRSMNTLMSNAENADFAVAGANASDDIYGQHSRMNSSGTNVLYKIRRQELAKGTSPSVRSMAQAFESMNSAEKTRQKGSTGAQLRGFFSIRKSRSVDNEAKKQKEFERLITSTHGDAAGSTGGLSIDAGDTQNDKFSASFTTTLPRGGRNPFKNMGAKIVERVRRSLSRSSRRDESVEASKHKTPIKQNAGEPSNDTNDTSETNTINTPSEINSALKPATDQQRPTFYNVRTITYTPSKTQRAKTPSDAQ